MVIRAIWEIFIIARKPGKEKTLNCDECFFIMEYPVDTALILDLFEGLRDALSEHMKHFPNCTEHHLQRLREVEDIWQRMQG